MLGKFLACLAVIDSICLLYVLIGFKTSKHIRTVLALVVSVETVCLAEVDGSQAGVHDAFACIPVWEPLI